MYSQICDILQPAYKKCTNANTISRLLRRRTICYWPEGNTRSQIFHARFPDSDLMIRMARLASKRYIKFWHPWHMEKTQKIYRLGRQIDWFTPPNGDNEWIYSLVRFTHMLDLAAAYKLTKRSAYLDAFENHLNSFIASRSQPGHHWKYKLNAAIRVINLIRAYDLIALSDSLPSSLHLSVYQCLLPDIQFLFASIGKDLGNGEFFITTALLIAAEYLSEFFQVENWKIRSKERLYEIISSGLNNDGITIEQVPMYHGQVILALLDSCVIDIANNRTIDKSLSAAITRMLKALNGFVDPEGYIPPIGDSDRFSASYINNYYHAVLSSADSQTLNNQANYFMPPKSHTKCKLTSYDATGWIIARWEYENNNRDKQGYILFDCSGNPTPPHTWHSHADDLQFLLHTTKGPIFTDPGRFTYCPDIKAYLPFTRKRIYSTSKFRSIYSIFFPTFIELSSRNWRDYFKRTLSHNTISQDGNDQTGYSKTTTTSSAVGIRRQDALGPLVFLEGFLDTGDKAYNENSYQHQRNIIGYIPNLWVIVDIITAEKRHNWVSSYHLDPRFTIASATDHFEIMDRDDTHHIRFLVSETTKYRVSIEHDWISRIYNKKVPAKTIRTTIDHSSNFVMATAILTHADTAMKLKDLTRTSNSHTQILSHNYFALLLTTANSETRLIINPERNKMTHDGIELDAMIGIETRDSADKQLLEFGFLGGTYMRTNDYSLDCDHTGGAYRELSRK